MKIIRLENTGFGFSSFCEDETDKILEFDSKHGTLKIHELESPQSFHGEPTSLLQSFGIDVKQGDVRIIRGRPVKNAYSAPLKLYLDINLACSLDCSFCLSEAGRGLKTTLQLETIQNIAQEIEKIGVMYVKIGGGDPFIHPDFEKIISALRNTGCFLTISTNSASITPSKIEILRQYQVRTSVSIEGMESVNDSFRGKGHFQKALKALDLLNHQGVDTLLRTTLLRQNLPDIPQLVALAIEHGVKIKFSYCRPAGRAVHNETMLSEKDASSYMQALEHLNSASVLPHVQMDEGMMFVQPGTVISKLMHGNMCGAANRSMHIDAYGKVSPCIFFGPSFSIGKIYQDGSIKDFWSGNVGTKFQAVRSIRQPRECDSCTRLCKNECPANRFYFWGNYEQQDPNCLHQARRKC